MNKQELLTLPQLHKDINTCIDDNLEMLCEKLGRIYSLSFYDMWDFKFDEKETEISSKIYLTDEINYKNLLKFNGLKLEDMQFNIWEDTLNEIRINLQKNIPVMIHMYRRLFLWDINYMKENVPDFFTHKAMAIDIDDKNILFTDGFCNKYNENLSIEQCKNSTTNKLTKIVIENNYYTDLKLFFYEFKINQLAKTNMFENIKKFAEELKKEKIIEELDKNKGDLYKYSPMFNSLNKITRSRRKIKLLLKDLGNKLNSNQLLDLSNNFDKSILLWEYINSIFIKYTLTLNKETLQKCCKYLLEIIDIEKELYNLLERVEI